MARMVGAVCPCGSGKALSECCGPYLAGSSRPQVAVDLMRSRYTAYCLRDGAYLRNTWHPNTRPQKVDFSGDDTEWVSLTILRQETGGKDDSEGIVEFVASYRQGGISGRLHERSVFLKESGEWFYLDGTIPSEHKPGRNEPCPCGSGKKYKKCCG